MGLLTSTREWGRDDELRAARAPRGAAEGRVEVEEELDPEFGVRHEHGSSRVKPNAGTRRSSGQGSRSNWTGGSREELGGKPGSSPKRTLPRRPAEHHPSRRRRGHGPWDLATRGRHTRASRASSGTVSPGGRGHRPDERQGAAPHIGSLADGARLPSASTSTRRALAHHCGGTRSNTRIYDAAETRADGLLDPAPGDPVPSRRRRVQSGPSWIPAASATAASLSGPPLPRRAHSSSASAVPPRSPPPRRDEPTSRGDAAARRGPGKIDATGRVRGRSRCPPGQGPRPTATAPAHSDPLEG